MKKILIIEDDVVIREELEELLNNAGYQVDSLTNFQNTLKSITTTNPDLVLLDINIPNINGEIILKKTRETSNVPIIMLTSKNTEIDEVLSMSYGANDYITKPYNPTILLLRIASIFRILDNRSNNLTYKDLVICPQKGIIQKDKEEILLTKNEMIIFIFLLNNQNRIVTRDELMTDLWNNNEYINDNALTVNISRLRSKLKQIGHDNAIETRKGQGYILL